MRRSKPAATSRVRSPQLRRSSSATLPDLQHRTLIDALPLLAWITDRDGTISYCNRNWFEYSGTSGVAAIAHQWASVLHPEDREPALEGWRSGVAKGHPFSGDYRIRRADGAYRWHTVRALPLRDNTSSVVGWMGIAVDIHEMMLAQAGLEEKSEKLSLALEIANLGTFDDYLEGPVQASDRAKQLLGLPPEGEVIFENFLPRVHPEDRGAFLEAIKRAMNPDSSQTTELTYRVTGVDGKLRWITVRFKCLFAGSGRRRKPARITGTLMDVTNAKTMENAVRNSEARLSAILNAEPECVKLFSSDYILQYINPAGLAVFQADSPEQICGKNLLDGLDPQYAAQFQELTERVFHGGTGTMEYEITGLKGRRLRLETHAVPLRDAKGYVEHLLAVTRDITEKKAAEEALRSSEQKFRALIENSQDAIALIGWEGKIIYCSPSTTKILDYTPEELLGQSIVRLLHPDDLRSVRRELELITRTPSKVGALNVRVRHKDGSWRLVEGTVTNLLENGDVGAIVANYRDVTERARAQQALQQAEERFEIAFRSSPLPMTISTLPEGRFLDVNEAFLALTGYTREDVLGRNGLELALWQKLEHRQALADALAENRVFSVLTTLRTSSGDIRQLELSAARIEVDATPCALIVSRDVTEAKDLEQRFRQAQKMEAIGRLAGGVAHDFNNILGVIIGYSDISREKLEREHPVAKHLAQIERAAERGASLTRQLLAFSRQQVVFPKALDLNSIINNINEMLARVIGEDIVLLFRPADRLPAIKCDPGQIEQIVMNLAVNARDAMPHGGRLSIETRVVEFDEPQRGEHGTAAPGRYVMLSISDTGCGMDEAIKAHLFEPFFTTKEAGKGTGLGLSTVYGIVKQNEGHISVYSEAGKGSTFKIYFPCVPDKAEPIETRLTERKPPRGTETILLVEDEHALRSLTKEMLRSGGYNVLDTDSPETATKILLNHGPVHLLLTDVIMPKTSGAELSKSLKALKPDLKVLFMSGYAGDILDQQFALVSDFALIEKPFSRSSLLSKVHDVLHPPSARSQHCDP